MKISEFTRSKDNDHTNKSVMEVLTEKGIKSKSGKPWTPRMSLTEEALAFLNTPVMVIAETPEEVAEIDLDFAGIDEALTISQGMSKAEKDKKVAASKKRYEKFGTMLTVLVARGVTTKAMAETLRARRTPATKALAKALESRGVDIWTAQDHANEKLMIQAVETIQTATEIKAAEDKAKKLAQLKHRQKKMDLAALADDVDGAIDLVENIGAIMMQQAARGNYIFVATAVQSQLARLEGDYDFNFKKNRNANQKADEAGEIIDVDQFSVEEKLADEGQEYEPLDLCTLQSLLDAVVESAPEGNGKVVKRLIQNAREKGVYGPDAVRAAMDEIIPLIQHARIDDESAAATFGEREEGLA